MKVAGRPFSGEIGFTKTEMSWPITHMVAPAEAALSCEDCHSKNGRLQGVEDVYISGREADGWLDKIGWVLAGLTLMAVLVHGAIRVYMYGKDS